MKPASILRIFHQRASETPNKNAFFFLNNKGEKVQTHTYASLSLAARKIARMIRSKAAPNDRVILLYPPGLDFVEAFFACLYAGVIAVPAFPPRKNAHALRIQSIVTDAQVNIALTTASEKDKLEKQQADFPFLQDITCLAHEDGNSFLPIDFKTSNAVEVNELAFLQYTSGSTGNPKGVMVGQQNILVNLEALHRHTRFEEGDTMVSWLPAFHDMGLIYGILLPIYMGNVSYLMAPVTFITQPLLWLQTIAQRKATHAVAPNFAFDLCADKLNPSDLENLDFSRLKYFANAAEPIREKSIERFAELFATQLDIIHTISPAYGLAEATLVVSCSEWSQPLNTCMVDQESLALHQVAFVEKTAKSAVPLVGSGKIIDGLDVRIVDPHTLQVCNAFEVGEIWVKGATVAKGYWQNEEQTKNIFQAYTADTNDGPFLRTGDLGFLKAGELFITGRLKDLILIEGVNHYPQDIEFVVQQQHQALIAGRGAAFSIDFGKGEKLVLVQEIHSQYAKDELEALQDLCEEMKNTILQNFGIEAHRVVLIKKSGVPLTSSGKVRRKECRHLFLENKLSVIAQSRDIDTAVVPQKNKQVVDLEKYFISTLATVFKMPATDIHPNQSLIDLGLDSISAMELHSYFRKDFQWDINITELLYKHSIREILEYLQGHFEAPSKVLTDTSSFLNHQEFTQYQEQDIDHLSEQELDELIATLETGI